MRLSLSGILISTLVAILPPAASQAQTGHETAIQKTLARYLEHTRNQDINALLDDLYPGVFAILPRDQMEAYFRQFFLDDEIRFRFESMDVRSISPVYEHAGRSFSKVEYHLVMTMHYLPEPKDESVMKMLYQNMQSEYGNDQVTMDTQAGTFRIETDKIMLAICAQANAPWKVMDFDPSLNTFLDQMDIPKDVVTHFGL